MPRLEIICGIYGLQKSWSLQQWLYYRSWQLCHFCDWILKPLRLISYWKFCWGRNYDTDSPTVARPRRHRELGQNQCGVTKCLLMLASPGWTGGCTVRNECTWTEAQRIPGMLYYGWKGAYHYHFYLERSVFLGCTSLLYLTTVLLIFCTQEEINKYADNDPATYDSMSNSSAPLLHYPDHHRSHLHLVAIL